MAPHTGTGRSPRPAWWGWPLTTVISAVVTVFTWRDQAWRVAAAGLDSWQTGLVEAFRVHLQWGPQMLFTFGPYGFVEDILPLSRLTTTISVVYAIAVAWGLAALIVSALRPSWGLVAAAVVAWGAVVLAANTLEAPELATGTAFGLAVAAVGSAAEAGRLRLPVLLGALAGFQVLVELNVGAVATVLTVLAVLGGANRARRGAASLTAFLLTLLVPYVLAGQHLTNLASYIGGSLQVTLGYSSAMSFSDGRRAEDVFALVLVVLVAAVYTLAFRHRPLRVRVAVALMLGGFGWESLKEGFVRHDQHDLIFCGLALACLCLARLPRPWLPVQGVAVVTAAVFSVVANGGVVSSMYSPLEDARALNHVVAAVLVPARLAYPEQVARYQLLVTGEQLPPSLVRALAPYTVAGEPWEVGLKYAYPGLRWRPEPVLQSYSAYTTYLDDVDANFLRSARAPQRILYQPQTVDHRYPYWDAPAAQLATYCRYKQIGAVSGWQVLARVPYRCGPARALGTVTAHFGQAVHVPAARRGEMVVATFALSSPALARLEGFLLKPPEVEVRLGSGDGTRTYRFVPGTAGDAHVISPASTLGYTAFAPTAVTALSFRGGGWSDGQGTVTVRFSAVPVRP